MRQEVAVVHEYIRDIDNSVHPMAVAPCRNLPARESAALRIKTCREFRGRGTCLERMPRRVGEPYRRCLFGAFSARFRRVFGAFSACFNVSEHERDAREATSDAEASRMTFDSLGGRS